MEDIYKFELDDEAFEKIVAGKKTAHLVINDNKCKNYSVGNLITFVKKQDGEGPVLEVKASIENLLYFGNVLEAVETLGKEACGFKPSATFEKTSDLFLSNESYEALEKYGIVALVFKVIE